MVANTALVVGELPVVNATTPLMSVPVTVTPEGDVPAPVDVAIVGVEELPFKCFALTVALVFTVVTLLLPSCMVLAVDTDAP